MVTRSEEILGQFRRNRDYLSTEVCIVESVFESDFPEALATFLHEHAHVFGYDGSRAFTDALTRIIETIIRHRTDLDRYEAQWEQTRVEVIAERGERWGTNESLLEDVIAGMSEIELRDRMAKIPRVVLRGLVAPPDPAEHDRPRRMAKTAPPLEDP